QAQRVIVGSAVVTRLGQRGAADAYILRMIDVGVVRRGEGVLLVELPAQPGRRQPELLGSGDVGYRPLRVALVVERDGVDHGIVVDGAVLERQRKVAAFFAHRATQLESVALLAQRGAAGGKRIARVHPGTAVGGEQ